MVGVTLDPRAPDWLVASHAVSCAGAARGLVASVGRSVRAPLPQDLARELDALAVRMGARPAPLGMSEAGRVARMLDPIWWRRNMRRELRRANEVQEHGAGHIRRSRQCYASDHTVKRAVERQKACAQVLERLEVVNEDGEALNLAEVVAGSVSNPAVRRAELMVRCRGFEEAAQWLGHRAVFLTLTAPSRFHRMRHQGGENPKWDGSTPRDAQNYLTALWASVRKAWGRQGFHPYGFRVCEPHHDGTPHWHLLLFIPADQVGWFVPERLIAGRKDHGAGVLGTMGRFALRDTPEERGAAEHRFKVEFIDPNRIGKDGKPCTATGYIAKYIAKNIDGLREDGGSVGLDFASGATAATAAQRVRAWAGTWGLRQFQQLGGPSVTAWRELRRLGTVETAQADLFDNLQAAADRGDWMGYFMLQGGPDTKPRDMPARPSYEDKEGGRYGDAMRRVVGVECAGTVVRTRLHEWTVQPAGLAEVNAAEAEFIDYMNREKAVAKFLQEAGISGRSEFSARSAGAWTGVNNCPPEPLGPVFDWSFFEPGETEIPYSPEYHREADAPTTLKELKWLDAQEKMMEAQWQNACAAWRSKCATTPPRALS